VREKKERKIQDNFFTTSFFFLAVPSPQMALFYAFISVIVLAVAILPLGAHFIDEGNVGVYYRAGALLKETTSPGLHFMLPLLTQVKQVQITLQTDELHNVPCGTSGGVMLYFERVEIVNQLSVWSVHDIVKNYTAEYDKVCTDF